MTIINLAPDIAINTAQNNDPNILQRAASNPDDDIWVSASAGSGKTKVLTDRVLRLLLPDPDGRWLGAKPHRILCITFTKAAAALMSLRVQKRLSQWAVMSDDEIRIDLEKNLFGFAPPEHVIVAAKKLFSEILDAPHGISIMTIHSFCQSVLGRFPIEAGINTGFDIMDEAKSNELLGRVITSTINHLQIGCADEKFIQSFINLSIYMDIQKLQELLKELLSDTWRLKEFLGKKSSHNEILNELLKCLQISPNETELSFWQKHIALISDDRLRQFAIDTKNDELAMWLSYSDDKRFTGYKLFKEVFFTKEGKIRVIKKDIIKLGYERFVNDICTVINDYDEQIAKLSQARQTADLLTIAAYCISQYESRKNDTGVLDFTDLILKARKLLSATHLEWVHFKLDEGIDHILVDEAQDTNVHQWEIIKLLSAEFQSGLGRETDRPRSLFVVGDEKQSIFSFHGADIDAFGEMQEFFGERSKSAGRNFNSVRLETSFRTTKPILKLVDSVFDTPEMRKSLGLNQDYKLVHYTNRPHDAGLVEIWDIDKNRESKQDDKEVQWNLPPVSIDDLNESINNNQSNAGLAFRVAMHIAGLLNGSEKIVSENRKIEPRDILVLVRTRTAFVGNLVRHLKRLNIPVSGVDRMQLNDQIAVMDCLALARFARFPDDDMALACVLRSPFIRIDEDELMQLALGRTGTLWDNLKRSKNTEIIRWLGRVIARAAFKKPFEFFDEIMNEASPRSGFISCWQAFLQDLGEDCRDPMEEFLGHCIKAENDGIYGLEEFLVSFQKKTIEIKRDVEGGDKGALNQVRIMTVHASKGLEAPIVYIPDSTTYPSKSKLSTIQWTSNSEVQEFPLWAASGSNKCIAYIKAKDNKFNKEISEYHRLLYVALTRARDRLYIMGESKKEEINPDCWYSVVQNGFARLGYKADDLNGKITIKSEQLSPIVLSPQINNIVADKNIPNWLRTSPETLDTAPIKIINPSLIDGGGGETFMSPMAGRDNNRFLRGNLSHRLFEILPEIDVEARQAAGENFLNNFGDGLSHKIKEEILNEVLKILNDPVFSHVFGKNSRAEVPISGAIGGGRVINGKIDRLVVMDDTILVVDFKTNRPSPDDKSGVPKMYIEQLNAYKSALEIIYPSKKILCALLWTDKPVLMRIN